MKKLGTAFFIYSTFSLFFLLTGCTDDNNDNIIQNINLDLIGTWTGNVDGSGGLASLTMILNDDGTMSSEGDNSFYNLLSGTWEATTTQFTATASGGGVVVSYDASVQGDSMAGTWTGNNSASGTFSAVKQ